MAEICARERGCDNIAGFFQLQGRLASGAVLEDTPKYHTIPGMDVALGHARENLLTRERRSHQVWNPFDVVTNGFSSGHGRGQHREYGAGGGVSLGGGYTTLQASMTEQGMLRGHSQA